MGYDIIMKNLLSDSIISKEKTVVISLHGAYSFYGSGRRVLRRTDGRG